MVDLQKIRDFFEKDRYLKLTGVQIDEADKDFAVCSMNISDIHLNAKNVVQGGATFTLADCAFAVASNASFIEENIDKVAVSQSASISYLKPARGKRLFAKASLVSGGKRISVYQMDVTDEIGTKVAVMIGNVCVIDLK